MITGEFKDKRMRYLRFVLMNNDAIIAMVKIRDLVQVFLFDLFRPIGIGLALSFTRA
jgi:hypothetical protein